jgi:hypothetical protein
MIYEQYFDGRKPSENQVINAIKHGLNKGHYYFEIAWGENMVTLEKGRSGVNQWIGWGWIKDISGHELAEQFNREGVF